MLHTTSGRRKYRIQRPPKKEFKKGKIDCLFEFFFVINRIRKWGQILQYNMYTIQFPIKYNLIHLFGAILVQDQNFMFTFLSYILFPCLNFQAFNFFFPFVFFNIGGVFFSWQPDSRKLVFFAICTRCSIILTLIINSIKNVKLWLQKTILRNDRRNCLRYAK